MTALPQPRRRPLRYAAAAVVAGLGLAATVSCAPAASPTTTGSSQAPSTSTPSTRAATSAPGSLDDQLLAAAWVGDVPTARRLIEAGADVNHLSSTTQSSFHIAASEGHLELLDLTLARGADVASLDSYRGISLIRAAERGHALLVGRLLQTPMKVNHVNRLKYTALHEAVILGRSTPSYADTVRLLVARGADVTLPAGEARQVPLDAARDRGYAPVIATVEAALAAKAVPAPTASAALLAAATRGDADAAAIALRQGADLETKDGGGRTPLILAVTHDRVEVARVLVALGADPDAQDAQQDSAWLVTGVTGSVAMLEALLPANPDLTLRNRFGGVSVIPASERGHVDYVRRVVKTGINVNHVNNPGWTALLEAVILGDGSAPYQQIVQILLDAGARPDLADRDGVTALQHARSSGQTKIAQLLERR
ncbi:MAG: ankyrin repeat domain-containing protein [Chloroflexota bacterium]|nr:ankyrin repeat domain-containing protein [Chloroflexota bacterium]